MGLRTTAGWSATSAAGALALPPTARGDADPPNPGSAPLEGGAVSTSETLRKDHAQELTRAVEAEIRFTAHMRAGA
jgi:hypothetical protein